MKQVIARQYHLLRHTSLNILAMALGLSSVVLSSCWKGWDVEYGKPVAHLQAADLASKGTPFVDQLVAVRGKVTTVDTSVAGKALVHLEGGITCDFGRLDVMAKSHSTGDEITVQGFLARCTPGDCVLSPSIARDPKAPFSPDH